MPSWLDGKPFALVVSVLFVIVLLRAQVTYWLGRGVTEGVLRTAMAGRISGPRTARAIAALNRWGLPLVTVSFLTIGFQTVVNAAAGLIRMPWVRYTLAMLIGCLAWALIYATVGIAAFEAAVALAARSPLALAGVLALVVIVVGALVVARRRRMAVPADDPTWSEPRSTGH